MAQNIKVNNAVNEIEETKPFVFVDPKTGEHYQVYGNGGFSLAGNGADFFHPGRRRSKLQSAGLQALISCFC
jgi:hypothetical protein